MGNIFPISLLEHPGKLLWLGDMLSRPRVLSPEINAASDPHLCLAPDMVCVSFCLMQISVSCWLVIFIAVNISFSEDTSRRPA